MMSALHRNLVMSSLHHCYWLPCQHAHLGYSRIKVVHDHVHDGRGRPTACRILPQGVGLHDEGGTETVHVDVAIATELVGKLGSQCGVEVRGEVAQGILEGQLLGAEGGMHVSM